MENGDFSGEISKRRTFAIVSHPDAGKTTLTEKFLWYGKVIREAGHIRAKASRKYTTSDWMKIERQRGISVSSSVLSFPYGGCQINLVDTPGHQDFCEDTFRALTAVDSVLVLLDAAKGVEPQTIKLMEVCRMRKSPVTVFMNKMDRDSLDPLALMDEVEKVLGLPCTPMTLPIGNGSLFQGVYSFTDDTVHFFSPENEDYRIVKVEGIGDPRLDEWFHTRSLEEFRGHAEMALGAMDRFDQARYLKGELAPVFFGSAIRNFGVKQLLANFVAYAPPPLPRQALQRTIEAQEPKFSAFVFKIQANTDPKHRDRVAFLRICSGKFNRGAKVLHCRTGREVRLAAPSSFLANSKELVEEAFAGDIIGIHDPGLYSIGDTISEQERLDFQGIPDFAPEHFMRVYLADPLRNKQLTQGLKQLSEEGATQLFYPGMSPAPVLGVVGPLQFEVIKFRLEEEYGAQCRMEPAPIFSARWLKGAPEAVRKFQEEAAGDMATDKRGRSVYLCPNEFRLNLMEKNHPGVQFMKFLQD